MPQNARGGVKLAVRKLAKTGKFSTGPAIIVLLLAVAALSVGFSSMAVAGASESPEAKQPMLKLEIVEGIKLAPDCGLSAFHAGLIQAFQSVAPNGSDAQKRERIDKAFQQQIQTLATMNNTAVERGRVILDKQLLAIRTELEADAQNQLAVYEQYLDGQDVYERQTFASEQKLARERFHRILEAQYTPLLLNLQMQLYSISLTERPEINSQVNMINDEIKGLVADREERDRLELEVFISTQAVRRHERLAEKRLSLAGWVEEEFKRLSELLQDNLVHENSAKASSIEAGISRRLEELGE